MRFNICNNFCEKCSFRSENLKILGTVMEKLNSNFVMSDFLVEHKEFVEK